MEQVQQKVVARGGLQGIGTVIVCPITHEIVRNLLWHFTARTLATSGIAPLLANLESMAGGFGKKSVSRKIDRILLRGKEKRHSRSKCHGA